MKHRVTFTFKPVVLEVETFSGKDVAEELARHLLRAKIAEGSTPIWMADCSEAIVEPLITHQDCKACVERNRRGFDGMCPHHASERATKEAATVRREERKQCDCTTINFHGHPCGAPATVAGLCSSCYRNCLPADAAE